MSAFGTTVKGLKAFRVTCSGLGFDDEPIVTLKYATTASEARMDCARTIRECYDDMALGRILRGLSVRRDRAFDEPDREITKMHVYGDREALEHSIGNWTGRPGTKPHRNYYCAGHKNTTIERLVGMGMMRASHTINDGRDTIYGITDKGRALVDGLEMP